MSRHTKHRAIRLPRKGAGVGPTPAKPPRKMDQGEATADLINAMGEAKALDKAQDIESTPYVLRFLLSTQREMDWLAMEHAGDDDQLWNAIYTNLVYSYMFDVASALAMLFCEAGDPKLMRETFDDMLDDAMEATLAGQQAQQEQEETK